MTMEHPGMLPPLRGRPKYSLCLGGGNHCFSSALLWYLFAQKDSLVFFSDFRPLSPVNQQKWNTFWSVLVR